MLTERRAVLHALPMHDPEPSIPDRLRLRRAWTPPELAAEFGIDEAALRVRLESQEAFGLPPSEWHDDWVLPYPAAFAAVDPAAAAAAAAADAAAREAAFAARLAAESPEEIAAATAALTAMLPDDWTATLAPVPPADDSISWHHTVSYHLEMGGDDFSRVSIGVGRGGTRLGVLARGMHTAIEARFIDSLRRAGFAVEWYALDMPSAVRRAVAPDGTVWFLAVPGPEPRYSIHDQAHDIYEALDDYGQLGRGIPWIVEPEYLCDPETLVAHLASVPPGGLPMPAGYVPYAMRRG